MPSGHLQDRGTVTLPRTPDQHSVSRQAKLTLLRVLEFNPETLKSGAVVLSADAPPGSALLFVRGAPSVVKDLVQPCSIPEDFDQVRPVKNTAMALFVAPAPLSSPLTRSGPCKLLQHCVLLPLLLLGCRGGKNDTNMCLCGSHTTKQRMSVCAVCMDGSPRAVLLPCTVSHMGNLHAGACRMLLLLSTNWSFMLNEIVNLRPTPNAC